MRWVAGCPEEIKLETAESPARVSPAGLASQMAADLKRRTGVIVAVDVYGEDRRGKCRTIAAELDEDVRDGVKSLLPQAQRPVAAPDDLLDAGRVAARASTPVDDALSQELGDRRAGLVLPLLLTLSELLATDRSRPIIESIRTGAPGRTGGQR